MANIGTTARQTSELVGFLAHEKGTRGTLGVVYIYEIARGENAKGKGWGTGAAMLCELIDDYGNWADEYHFITRSIHGSGHTKSDGELGGSES